MADVIKIDSNTWRIEDGMVRFFLLEGEDAAAMIDSGMNCPNALEIAKGLTHKPIMLINTHGDVDHVSGTASFDKIYMNSIDYIQCGVGGRFPETKLVELCDGELIKLGDRTLKIIHIPGHTYGSIAVLDVSNRVLLAGDSVQKGNIFMFGNNRAPEKYVESLDKLIAMSGEYDKIYASHDEYVLPGDYATKVKSSWIQVQNGEVEYKMIDMFGNKVKAYKAEACGFFMF